MFYSEDEEKVYLLSGIDDMEEMMELIDGVSSNSSDPASEETVEESEGGGDLDATEADLVKEIPIMEPSFKLPPMQFRHATANLQQKVYTAQHVRHLITQMKSMGIDSLGCQESGLSPNTSMVINGYICHTGPSLGKGKVCNMFVANLAKFRKVAPVKSLSSTRIQVFELRYHGNRVYIINYHRPYKGCRVATRVEFDEQLLAVKEALKNNLVILSGDSNAQPDREMALRLGVVQSEYSFLATAECNDENLEKVLGSHGLGLLNHRFAPSHKRDLGDWKHIPYGVTWRGPQGTQRIYDHIAASQELLKDCQGCFRAGDLFGNPDHATVVATFKVYKKVNQGAGIPRRAIPDIALATAGYAPQMRHSAPHTTNIRIRTMQEALNRKRHAIAPEQRTPEECRELNRLNNRLKRQLGRLEARRWTEAVHGVASAANSGNFRKAFDLLKSALNVHSKSGPASDAELKEAVENAITSLTQEPPTTLLDTSAINPNPEEIVLSEPTHVINAWTDGSKFRKSRQRTKAGAGVYCPELDIETSCNVPSSIRQTSTAGEVTAILLLLRLTRHLPPDTILHILCDNSYVVYTLTYKLEVLQQQDFSDAAHPDLWREIVRELVEYPRMIRIEWVQSHTNHDDTKHHGNDKADTLAKEAASGRPSGPPPDIDTNPVTSPIRGSPPSQYEVEYAVRSLPKDAAASIDPTPSAALQTREAIAAVYKVVTQCWTSLTIPEEAVDNLMVFVPKADPKALPRAITMRSCIVKVIMTIISIRLRVIPMLPAQYGFQRARDTLMPIKLLTQAIRSARRRGKRLYCVFVDFSDAYNSLHRPSLLRTLEAHGVPPNIVTIIGQALGGTTYIRDTDTHFQATSGVPQGDPASPLLFALALNAAMRASSLADAPFNVLAYADDVVIFGEDPEAIQTHLSSFQEKTAALGLRMNIKKGKTEAMCILTEKEERIYRSHLSAFKADGTRGALSMNPQSTTADTRDGTHFEVLDSGATHLWCPLCENIQEEHTTQKEALDKLRRHFREKHPGRALSGPPIPGQSTLNFAADPKPLHERNIASGIPQWNFHVNVTTESGETTMGNILWTREYKYLGGIIDLTASSGTTVKARISRARGAFYALAKLWDSTKVRTNIKTWLLETIVTPSLLYGLTSIVLSKDDIADLEYFHKCCLLRIMGCTDAKDYKGDPLPISYEESVIFASTECVKVTLARLRVALAGRMARAQRGHPLREVKCQEWDSQIIHDIRLLNKQARPEDITDRFRCRALTARRNPHLLTTLKHNNLRS